MSSIPFLSCLSLTVVGSSVKRLTQQSFFPHLLLFGPPGTGKTSAILAVARLLYGSHQSYPSIPSRGRLQETLRREDGIGIECFG